MIVSDLNLSLDRDADSHYFCDMREDWSSEAGEMRDIQGKL